MSTTCIQDAAYILDLRMKRYCANFTVTKPTVKNRMVCAISFQKGEVVMPCDFVTLGSPRQVARGLQELLKEGKIVRLGHGVYAKARPSCISGKPVPRVTLEELGWETLQKLGVEPRLGYAQRAYAEGRTTQVPMKTTFDTGTRRITRKITVGLRSVTYENDFGPKR